MTRGRTLVAMSGGVDSAVAAALLREAGHDIFGVTLHLWDARPPQSVGRCCAPDDRDDARRVCDALGIAHYVLDARERFRSQVVEPFVEEHRAGRTPSPCVHCNAHLKLDFLTDLADRLGADGIATGHYARVHTDGRGVHHLLRGRDSHKDQSYFLFGLSQAVLGRLQLPLGELTKDQARREAERLGLHVARKPDSQELCFIPDGDVKGFLQREGLPARPGLLRSTSGGELGRHGGIAGFTVGQRRGIGLGGGPPRYVVRIDTDTAAVVVGSEDELLSSRLRARGAHWTVAEPSAPVQAHVRIRYRHRAAPAVVTPQGDCFEVCFEQPQRAIAPGQAAVLYQDDEVIGGGFIA